MKQQHLASDRRVSSRLQAQCQACTSSRLSSNFSLYSWIVYILTLMQMIICIGQDILDVGTWMLPRLQSLQTQASLQRETSLYTRSEISQLQVFQKMFSKIQNHLLCTSPLLTSILPQSLMYPSYTAIHLPLFLMSVY